MKFLAACVQTSPKKADINHNLDEIVELVHQSASEGADLVIFPETATSGYFLEGGVLENALSTTELESKLTKRLTGSNLKVDLVVGFYEESDEELYNSAGYFEIENGTVRAKHVYRKFFLPTYGVFDEERFVGRGRDLGVFETRFGTVGLLICEDVWHSISASLVAMANASVLIVPTASPARGFQGEKPSNLLRYEQLFESIASEHSMYVLNSSLCGFEGGKGFVGGSVIVDPFGKILNQSPLIEQHILLAQIDTDLVATARAQSPLLSDLRSHWADIMRIANDINSEN